MTPELAAYPGYRFPAKIIGYAVSLYHVFSLSLRDVELVLAGRGIGVTHESVRQWCLRFGSDFGRKLRRRRPKPGDTWHLDEVFLRINGVLHYLWRAVDQHGVVLDILVQDRRSASAAQRFFKRLLAGFRFKPSAASSRTGCAATVWRSVRFCPRSSAEPAAIGATELKTRIGRRGAGSARCSGSSHRSRRSASCHPTP
jgi:hypothetical protein